MLIELSADILSTPKRLGLFLFAIVVACTQVPLPTPRLQTEALPASKPATLAMKTTLSIKNLEPPALANPSPELKYIAATIGTPIPLEIEVSNPIDTAIVQVEIQANDMRSGAEPERLFIFDWDTPSKKITNAILNTLWDTSHGSSGTFDIRAIGKGSDGTVLCRSNPISVTLYPHETELMPTPILSLEPPERQLTWRSAPGKANN